MTIGRQVLSILTLASASLLEEGDECVLLQTTAWVVTPRLRADDLSLFGLSDDLTDMRTYYINMDSSTSRRETMETYVSDFGLPAERFPAVDQSRIASGEFKAKYVDRQGFSKEALPRLVKSKSLDSTLGCFISHSEVLELAQKEAASPDQHVMVLEDDVEIPEDWRARVLEATRAAPKDWKLLKLSGWGSKRAADKVDMSRKFGYAGNFYLLQAPYRDGPTDKGSLYYGGSAAYIVKASNIPAVLQHVRNQPITDYDAMLLSGNGSFRAYEIFPHVFDLRAEHEFSEIRANGFIAAGRWFVHKVRSTFLGAGRWFESNVVESLF